ncbi:MAG TPA: ABC transporter ATP-binding protein [Gemmatimonadaceae bacterium]|nr:ABC transporter ATP-binding protein [Gemmatimonadaceae bacterium]
MDAVLGRQHPEPLSPVTAGTLSLVGLTRRFGATAAVDDLSLEIARGELLALIGASGSGKTTTLRMVAGYEVPDAGAVVLTDPGGTPRDITALPPQRRDFGMVFQHYALFPHMTVGENVAFGLEARGAGRRERLARAESALANVGLAGAASRQVQSLSGGEQQRVALARAVVIEPRVLLLDEPLSNLDPTLRRTMRDELRATLRRLGVTALFVTHDQEDAFAIADRVALIRQGRLLQVGTPEELYDRPASREVAEFIGRATLLRGRLESGTITLAVGGIERRVAAVLPGGPVGADRATAVLRPDALTLDEAGAPGAWPGTVVGRRFAGAMLVVHVALADGVAMEVHATNRSVREGERVAVRVAREPVAVVDG